jgi:hypothetical protein
MGICQPILDKNDLARNLNKLTGAVTSMNYTT